MIKANELRIGNWILVRSKNRDVNANHILALSNGVDFYSGIQLTTEILEKCGAKPSDDFYSGHLINISDDGSSIRIMRDDKGLYWYSHCNYVRLEYLHQLQNLYFALTGQELQISL